MRNRGIGFADVLAAWTGAVAGGIQALLIVAIVRPDDERLSVVAILLVFASLGLLIALMLHDDRLRESKI